MPPHLTLFTSRSGVQAYLSAKMPLIHYFQVILPVRGQLRGMCQLKVTPVSDCLKTHFI